MAACAGSAVDCTGPVVDCNASGSVVDGSGAVVDCVESEGEGSEVVVVVVILVVILVVVGASGVRKGSVFAFIDDVAVALFGAVAKTSFVSRS